MPFIVYRKDGNWLIREKEVSLAGKRGALYCLFKAKSKGLNLNENGAIEWEASEEEILNVLGFSEEEYRLIIDLKPNVENNVSLYYLRRVFCYSEAGWTPIALQLETIFVDEEVRDKDKFKKKFQLPSQEGDKVHEFLYLQGGWKEGRWVWGREGSVNGCLLWPDAFKFFVRKIQPYLP